MFDFLLNSAILAFGAIGGLTAIGGETWVPDKPKFFDRITPRGWIAISALLASLICGLVKEWRSSSSATSAAKENSKLVARIAELQGSATSTQSQLENLKTTLGQSTLQHAKELNDARSEVVKLRESLQISEKRYYGLVNFAHPDQEWTEAFDLDFSEPLALFGGEIVRFKNDYRANIALILVDKKQREYIIPLPPGANDIKIPTDDGPMRVFVAKDGHSTGSMILTILSANKMRHERRDDMLIELMRIPDSPPL